MIHAYTFVKAAVAIYLLFIFPSIWFARSFYIESKLLTLKALRFAIILPAAFAAVIFIEVPKMIWQDRASELVSSGWETFIVVAVINLILLSLTYRFKPRIHLLRDRLQEKMLDRKLSNQAFQPLVKP